MGQTRAATRRVSFRFEMTELGGAGLVPPFLCLKVNEIYGFENVSCCCNRCIVSCTRRVA